MDGGIHLEQHAYDREFKLFLPDIGLWVLRFVNTENTTLSRFDKFFSGKSTAPGQRQIRELKAAAEAGSVLEVIF